MTTRVFRGDLETKTLRRVCFNCSWWIMVEMRCKHSLRPLTTDGQLCPYFAIKWVSDKPHKAVSNRDS